MKKLFFTILLLVLPGIIYCQLTLSNIGDRSMVAISPNNEKIGIINYNCCGNTNGYVSIFDVKTLKNIMEINIEHVMNGREKMVFSNNNKYVAFTSVNKIYIYHFETKKTSKIEFDKRERINDIDISPDCNFIAISHGGISIYDVNRLKELYTINQLEYYKPFNAIKYFHKGDRIVAGCEGAISIYDTKNGEFKKRFGTKKFSNSSFEKFLITENDSLLITTESVNEGNNLYFYDMNNYTYIRGYNFEFVLDIDICPDNDLFVVGTNDKIYFFNIKTEKITFSYNIDEIYSGGLSLAVSPNYEYLYCIQNNTLKHYKFSNIEYRSELFRKHFKNFISEIDLKYKYYNPRGEFETIDDYMVRAKSFLEDIYQIRLKYLNDINNGELVNLQKADTTANVLMNKINASIRDTTLVVEEIGEYDIDKQTLSIRVKGITKTIYMKTEDAKSFKENRNDIIVRSKCKLKYDLKNLEFYDIIIIHPTTKKGYKFE